MTTLNTFPERNRDMQDGTERHIFNKQEYVPNAGSVVTVDGTGTVDQEVVVLNAGYGQTYAEETDTEVIVLAGGSDTTQKYAFITIPRDKQRQWPEGTGGVQHPADAARALQFQDSKARMIDSIFAVGNSGIFETDEITYPEPEVYVRGNLYVSGNVHALNHLPPAPDKPPQFNGDP